MEFFLFAYAIVVTIVAIGLGVCLAAKPAPPAPEPDVSGSRREVMSLDRRVILKQIEIELLGVLLCYAPEIRPHLKSTDSRTIVGLFGILIGRYPETIQDAIGKFIFHAWTTLEEFVRNERPGDVHELRQASEREIAALAEFLKGER